MKKCSICNNFPVIKGSGMCIKHHNQFTKEKRKFKKLFIKNKKEVKNNGK